MEECRAVCDVQRDRGGRVPAYPARLQRRRDKAWRISGGKDRPTPVPYPQRRFGLLPVCWFRIASTKRNCREPACVHVKHVDVATDGLLLLISQRLVAIGKCREQNMAVRM